MWTGSLVHGTNMDGISSLTISLTWTHPKMNQLHPTACFLLLRPVSNHGISWDWTNLTGLSDKERPSITRQGFQPWLPTWDWTRAATAWDVLEESYWNLMCHDVPNLCKVRWHLHAPIVYYRDYRNYRYYRDYRALFRGPKLGDCHEITSTRAAGCGVCTRGMVERMDWEYPKPGSHCYAWYISHRQRVITRHNVAWSTCALSCWDIKKKRPHDILWMRRVRWRGTFLSLLYSATMMTMDCSR